MDLVFTITSSYIKYAFVAMASICVNQPRETEINFWFVQHDFTDSDKEKINSFLSEYEKKAYFVFADPKRYEKFVKYFEGTRWATVLLNKLFLHQLLPNTLDRVLYLDVDLVVDGDITDFYNLPFDDNYIVGTPTVPASKAKDEPDNEFDCYYIKEYNKSEVVQPKKTLFNAGVLLLNLKKFRDNNIDSDYYLESITGLKNIMADEGVFNGVFLSETKMLKTCKYDYYINQSIYNKDGNNSYFDKYKYEFVKIEGIKIYHYCGLVPKFLKPWDIQFNTNEIGSYECNVFDLIPEVADYYDVWWKYAKLVPDYDDFYQNMLRNKAAYKMLQKVFLLPGQGYGLEICNHLGIEQLKVPAWRDKNSILMNDDLNKYIQPKVYRCKNAQIKETIKNLPEDFKEKCGFRLTVKHIACNAAEEEMTSTIQILESNNPNAAVYRRYCGRPKKGTWSKWYRMATTDDIKEMCSQTSDKLQMEADVYKRLSVLEANYEKCMKVAQELNKEKEKTKKIESELKNVRNKLKKEKTENENIRKSFSYRIGRFVTFIPRKIRELFRKK